MPKCNSLFSLGCATVCWIDLPFLYNILYQIGFFLQLIPMGTAQPQLTTNHWPRPRKLQKPERVYVSFQTMVSHLLSYLQGLKKVSSILSSKQYCIKVVLLICNKFIFFQIILLKKIQILRKYYHRYAVVCIHLLADFFKIWHEQ